MDRVVVVGNCQASALEHVLRAHAPFSARFELVSFPPVHEIPEAKVRDLHDAVAGAAVVVPQRIDEGYRDGVGLGTETLARVAGSATVVRWPSVYWAGYVPELFYLRDAAGGVVVDGPFDYHDRTILEAYAQGADVATTCRTLADPERPSDAPQWAAAATAELEQRGRDCDVQVTSYIASRYCQELLFFTMNHPSNRLLCFLAAQIVELLGIASDIDERLLPGELLGSTLYPLHANHVRALGLRFGDEFAAGRTPFRIRGETIPAAPAVRAFYRYYDAHPQLVELNLDRPAA